MHSSETEGYQFQANKKMIRTDFELMARVRRVSTVLNAKGMSITYFYLFFLARVNMCECKLARGPLCAHPRKLFFNKDFWTIACNYSPVVACDLINYSPVYIFNVKNLYTYRLWNKRKTERERDSSIIQRICKWFSSRRHGLLVVRSKTYGKTTVL